MSAGQIYVGQVAHTRLTPIKHRFRYRVFSLLLDLDRLDEAGYRWLRIDRPGLMSFRRSDHGDGQTDLAQWARGQFGDLAADKVKLLCFPRMLGYVFNPLAIYFAYDAQDQLTGVLYQVTNTFGDRHSYLIPADGDGTVRQTADKRLHVSPFNGAGGRYGFRLSPPADRFALTITQTDANHIPILVATQTGRARPLNDNQLMRMFFSHPLMSMKVMAAIHWEAAKLFAKGMGYHRRPAPPDAPVSVGHSQTISLKRAG